MKTRTLITLIILIALGIGGFFVYKNIFVPEEKPEAPSADKEKLEESEKEAPEDICQPAIKYTRVVENVSVQSPDGQRSAGFSKGAQVKVIEEEEDWALIELGDQQWRIETKYLDLDREKEILKYLRAQGIETDKVFVRTSSGHPYELFLAVCFISTKTHWKDALNEIKSVYKITADYLAKQNFFGEQRWSIGFQARKLDGENILKIALDQEEKQVGGEFAYIGPITEKEILPAASRGKGVEMLIFLSPKYTNESSIKEAVNQYVQAVKDDIGWEIKLIELTDATNTIGNIRKIIKEYYLSDGIYTALIVGDDIPFLALTEVGGEKQYSIVPWAELDEAMPLNLPSLSPVKVASDMPVSVMLSPDIAVEEIDSILNEPRVRAIVQGTKPEVAISLLLPVGTINHQSKVNLIKSAFEKYSIRNLNYGNEILILSDPTMISYQEFCESSIQSWSVLGPTKCLAIQETKEVRQLLSEKNYKLLGAFGHGSPEFAYKLPITYLYHEKGDEPTKFAPVLVVSGCFTAGFRTEGGWASPPGEEMFSFFSHDANAVKRGWYIAPDDRMLPLQFLGLPLAPENPVRVVIGGIPNVFMGYAANFLAKGKTFAEAWLDYPDSISIADQLIFGDPTFHY